MSHFGDILTFSHEAQILTWIRRSLEATGDCCETYRAHLCFERESPSDLMTSWSLLILFHLIFSYRAASMGSWQVLFLDFYCYLQCVHTKPSTHSLSFPLSLITGQRLVMHACCLLALLMLKVNSGI